MHRQITIGSRIPALIVLALTWAAPALAQTSVYIEELTWLEVRDALKAGKTTVIIPSGGTEQKGQHMAMGAHNVLVHYMAGEIARRLDKALVAPVLQYVPEGNIEPPTSHMRMAGTITLPMEHFQKVTEWAARSFKTHGFTNIVLIGDSGGNQAGLKAVAELLNREWAGSGTRVHHASDYYEGHGFDTWLVSQGETKENIGGHAGLDETSLVLAVNPNLIRKDKLAPNASGASGDPRRATIAYGKKGLEMRIEATVKQIGMLIGTK